MSGDTLAYGGRGPPRGSGGEHCTKQILALSSDSCYWEPGEVLGNLDFAERIVLGLSDGTRFLGRIHYGRLARPSAWVSQEDRTHGNEGARPV